MKESNSQLTPDSYKRQDRRDQDFSITPQRQDLGRTPAHNVQYKVGMDTAAVERVHTAEKRIGTGRRCPITYVQHELELCHLIDRSSEQEKMGSYYLSSE